MTLFHNTSPILFALFLLLTVRQNIWAWVVGILYAVANYSYVFLVRPAFIFSSYLVVVNLLLFVYGAWVWYQNGHRFFHQPAKQYYPITSLFKQPYSKQKLIFLFVVLSILLIVSVLLKLTTLVHFHIFAFVIIYAIGFILLVDKKIEGWIVLLVNEILAFAFRNSGVNISSFWSLFNVNNFTIIKLIIFIYGFVYWKSKFEQQEEIKLMPFVSVFKTGFLSLIYISTTMAVLFLVNYLSCMNSTDCSSVSAVSFIVFLFAMSFIMAMFILLIIKEHFKQLELFFLANGLFGMMILNLVMKMRVL